MADIRINSLPTTASASSSDDFLALDGATNGTRKLNAYSPTFGGNVTASGNLTVSGVTTSAGISNSGALTFTAAIGQVAGSIAKNATYGLTYYGVTGSSNDNTILNASGAVVLSNPAGTTNATLAGNLTVSGTSGATATDLTLGSSGPSVKSSLSARAPRQGLVFDGTASSTVTIPVVGTADFSVNFWVTPNTSVAYAAMLASPNGGIYLTSLTPKILNESSAVVVAANAALSLGKTSHVTYTRSGTTGTWYINGVAAGSGTDSTNYSVAWSYIGSTLVGTIGGLNLYNRALSASEVVALYEAGAPAGADYNSASNTAINTSAWANYSNPTYAYQSFTSASATGFTASNSTNPASGLSVAVMAPQVTTFRAGTRYLVTFSATLTSGEAPKLRIGDSAGKSNEHTVTAGSNSVVLTTTSSVTATENIIFFNTLATSFSVSSVSVTRLGLLLAPDAAQAGGGLVWYDTSGNAANITLPASGVTWNVPTSSKSATGWSFLGNLAAGANITYAQAGTATLTIGEQGNAHSADNNRNIAYRWKYNKTADAGLGGTFQLLPMLANYPNAPTEGSVMLSVATNGNLLLKSDGQDSGNGKLQLATHTTSAGGIGFGTDISLYRPQAGVLAIDGSQAALYLRDSGTTKGRFNVTASTLYIDGVDASGSTGQIILRTGNGGTTALTLDSSQNATFAGSYVRVSNSGASASPAFQLANGSYGFGHRMVNSTDLQFFRDINSPTAWLTVTGTTGDATFAGTVTATVNKSAANYTTVTTYVAAGSTTTTVHTFANANTNRSWIVSTRQQGSASNTVIGFATTYGGTLVVYRIAQSNTTGGVLDMNFTASGLNLQLVLGSGFGSTTWDTTITPIQG